MTIKEAIKHAEEVADNNCSDCADEHRQLADWLLELVKLREEKRKKKYEYSVRDMYGFVSNAHKPSRLEAFDCVVFDDERIVRREVGEWEEVDDVQQ